MFDYVDFLYDAFGVRELAHAELATRPDNKLGTDEQWDSHRGRAAAGARADRPALPRRRGRGRVLRAEDRLLHGRRARPSVADGDDPARRPAARAARLHVHGRRQPRAHAVRHPPRAVRLARALHRDPARALRRRPAVLARAGAGARAAGWGGASRGCARPRPRLGRQLPRRGRPSRRRRSASGSVPPSSTRSRSRSSTATARATRASRCASAAASSRPSPWPSFSSQACYPPRSEKQGRTRSSPPGPQAGPRGFNRVEVMTRKRAAACSGFSCCDNETRRSKPNLVICL